MKRKKELVRLVDDKVIFGIYSGIARYIGWDRTLVRIIFILLFLVTGFFPISAIYMIGFFIMPKGHKSDYMEQDYINVDEIK